MILSAQSIRKRNIISPFNERTKFNGMTYGLGPAGYDVRIMESFLLKAGTFSLASTMERFDMPNDVLATVHDKSTWARKGLATQTTVIEPSWVGYLTLELTNHSDRDILLITGSPIAQIIFHLLDEPTIIPYSGKYMNQQQGPQPAILESEDEQISNSSQKR